MIFGRMVIVLPLKTQSIMLWSALQFPYNDGIFGLIKPQPDRWVQILAVKCRALPS